MARQRALVPRLRLASRSPFSASRPRGLAPVPGHHLRLRASEASRRSSGLLLRLRASEASRRLRLRASAASCQPWRRAPIRRRCRGRMSAPPWATRSRWPQRTPLPKWWRRRRRRRRQPRRRQRLLRTISHGDWLNGACVMIATIRLCASSYVYRCHCHRVLLWSYVRTYCGKYRGCSNLRNNTDRGRRHHSDHDECSV